MEKEKFKHPLQPNGEKWPCAIPVCHHCGQPSPKGDPCEACHAAKLRGYSLETDDVSDTKNFKDWSTYHFHSGFKAGQQAK